MPLVEGLGRADRKWFKDWQSHTLRPLAETEALIRDGRVRLSYCDPSLVKQPRTYAGVLWRLPSCGMLRWSRARGREGSLGSVFGGKGDKLRMVLVTRLVNVRFADSRSTRVWQCRRLGTFWISKGLRRCGVCDTHWGQLTALGADCGCLDTTYLQ